MSEPLKVRVVAISGAVRSWMATLTFILSATARLAGSDMYTSISWPIMAEMPLGSSSRCTTLPEPGVPFSLRSTMATTAPPPASTAPTAPSFKPRCTSFFIFDSFCASRAASTALRAALAAFSFLPTVLLLSLIRFRIPSVWLIPARKPEENTGGRGGIRTHGAGLAHNRLAGDHLRPTRSPFRVSQTNKDNYNTGKPAGKGASKISCWSRASP